MKHSCMAALTAGAVLLAMNATAATTPAAKCEAGRNSATGKYALCLQKAQQKFVRDGSTDTEDRDAAQAECGEDFSASWAKLSLAAEGSCPVANEVDVQDFVDACMLSAENALAGGTLPLDVLTCNEQLDICLADGGAGPGVFTITISQTDTAQFGALQFQLDYSGVTGEFTGTGGSAACVRTAGMLHAFNDNEFDRTLTAGMIVLNDSPGPYFLTTCEFTAPSPPSAGDFPVTIQDATDENGTPISIAVAVSVARKL